MGMSFYENLVGGYLSGLVLETILLGVITVQASLYYQRFPEDHIALKFVVGFLWLVQTFEVVVSSISAYKGFILHFGIPALTSVWYDTMYQICTVFSSVPVQFFFVFRLHRFSRSTWLPTLLGVLTLGQLGTGVAICVRANVTHGIESIIRPERPLLISWQTLEAMADLIIAFSMSYYLQNRRTGFRRTDTVIRKLIVYAINTGLVTSVLALAVMFAFAFYGFHFVHMLFILPLGGVYTVSLLANLHSRSILREELYSEHGISIHVSRLPPTIQNRINSVAQRIEMHYSGEETDQTLLAAGPSSSRPSRAETEATRHSGQSGTLNPEILWSGHV